MNSRESVAVMTALGLLVGVGGTGGAASAVADADPAVHSTHFVYGVTAITPDDALMVGTGGDDLSVRGRHWDGQSLQRARPVGGALTELWAVSAISSADAWGVGDDRDQTLAEHWNGHTWTQVATPPKNPIDYGEAMFAVDGASANDVWAVGYTDHCGCGQQDALIEHWDGHAWTRTQVDLPGGVTNGFLQAVTVISHDDAWAVGSAELPNRGNFVLTLHWNGSTWSQISTHPSDTSGAPFGIDAASSDDIWAVGAAAAPDSVTTLHWDGQTWTRVAAHVGDHPWSVDWLFGIAAISPDDAWAVGGYGQGTRSQFDRLMHWDGTRWHKVHVPDPGSTYNELDAISATGPNDIWAVGTYSSNPDPDIEHAVYLHYDGTHWTRVHQHGVPVL